MLGYIVRPYFNILTFKECDECVIRYLGGLESLHARLSATVCQKNMGFGYIPKVENELI